MDASFISPNTTSPEFMPLNGGEETLVLDQPPGDAWYNWALARTGICFLNLNAKPSARIDFFDFSTRKTRPVLVLEKPFPGVGGMSVSLDTRSVLYVQNNFGDSSIMLVRNGR